MMKKKTQVRSATLNLYGIEIPCVVMEAKAGDREFDSGRERVLTGTYDRRLYSSVLAAATEIIAAETECSRNDGPCWCWYCRAGAGWGEADEQSVYYITGSGHGTYVITATGLFKVYGSPRSLAGGSEYASLN